MGLVKGGETDQGPQLWEVRCQPYFYPYWGLNWGSWACGRYRTLVLGKGRVCVCVSWGSVSAHALVSRAGFDEAAVPSFSWKRAKRSRFKPSLRLK